MKTLDELRRQLSAGDFEFSRHAFKRAVERNISSIEIQQAGTQARIIEDYPEDKYAPSSLLLGFTIAGRPLHMQVSHVDSDLLKIITIYEPDPAEWYDHSRRR
ncbi:MAG: DUF4258 domain-containing protein [Nitrospira sp.]|nr:DUF4258 domain-containing protein [Nitrospira sp.]MBH0181640.1 DUF4258 domain-containing protein [Nitrospira sp.]MBH0184269.1 DUF4258 domain-containing protein [Nitrospira sp.]